MWKRAELKRRGKVAFKSNYGRSVLAAFLLSMAVGGIAFNSVTLTDEQLSVLMESITIQNVMMILRAAVPGLLLTMIISIFLLAPVNVGCRRFFIHNSGQPEKFTECFYIFRHNYWNVVMVLFIEQIYLFLWGLLLIFPAIIKAYSYRMVPYILAEHPDLSAGEAITRSRRMMNGHKWRTFVLDLSFLGWALLSLFTLGILTYLYVMPYMYSTDAELYLTLSGQSGSDGGYGSAGGFGGPGYDDNGPYDEPDPHEDPFGGY